MDARLGCVLFDRLVRSQSRGILPPESLAVNLSHRESPELGDYAAYEVIRIRWNPHNSELCGNQLDPCVSNAIRPFAIANHDFAATTPNLCSNQTRQNFWINRRRIHNR